VSTLKSSAENLTLNADGANNDIILQSNGSTKVTLDGQNSRLGIGTATPASELHISDSGGCTLTMTGESVVSSITAHGGGFNYNAAASKYHTFVVDGTDEVKISGDGILFGSDTAAANALDDYEEGTWTPANSGASFTGTPTGTYTKIGDLVTVRFNFTINSIGSGATNRITGLPFAVRGGAEGYGVSGNYSGLARSSCYCWCYSTGSNVYFIDSTAIDANSGVNAAVLQDGTNIPGQVTYWTNS